MVYFGTIGQLYKTTSFLVVSTSFHSEMRKGVGNNKETTSLFFHYYYLTKTCNQGNHSVVKTTNLFLQCTKYSSTSLLKLTFSLCLQAHSQDFCKGGWVTWVCDMFAGKVYQHHTGKALH